MGFLAPVALSIAGAFGTAAAAVGISYAVGFFVGIAVLNIAAISLIGNAIKALSPDIPSLDQYAGIKLQTSKNNYSPVPVVYGFNKTGSNIVFQETNEAISGATNKDYWSIQILADGEINEVSTMYADEIEMNEVSTGIFTTDYTHVKVYGTSGSSGIYTNSISFATSSAGATSTGSALGLTNVLIPPNVAFIAVHQKFDATNHQQLDAITHEIEGKKVLTITDSSTIGTTPTYSNNPAEVVLDVLLNYLYIPQSQIDIASFYNSKVKCNSYGYTTNTSFVQQLNIQGTVQSLLSTFRGKIVYTQGYYKLKLDEKGQTASVVLTDDDIINNSLNIAMKGFNEIANKITVKYINPDDSWLSAQVSFEDQDLIDIDGQVIERVIEIIGCTNTAHAEKLAEITLNATRYTELQGGERSKQTPIVLSFTTTIKNAELEVGDIISLDHSLFQRDRLFSVLSVESDQSGAIKIGAVEYCDTHYRDSAGTYLI